MRPAHGGNAMYGLPWPLLHVQRMLSQTMLSGVCAVCDAGAAHPTRGAGTRVFLVLSGRGTCPNVQKVSIPANARNETAQGRKHYGYPSTFTTLDALPHPPLAAAGA